ncbi:hypothetical protein BGZ63DRAFT_446076 [Mariannaea sp. PMI_226]|nr:hypothetical protein BGZ63DRAFT_446076 [Mariannaea sp. PMI_226]
MWAMWDMPGHVDVERLGRRREQRSAHSVLSSLTIQPSITRISDGPTFEARLPRELVILPKESSPVSPALARTSRHLVPRTGSATTQRRYLDEDFEIAIICALPLEYDAVSLVLDDVWDEHGGQNSYKAGRIGRHNVILALLSGIGKASAASTAASIRLSYRCLRLAFLVGICGGVPQTGATEILLGDVVISKGLVQYDFGRQYPQRFECKDGLEDSTSYRPDKDVRNQLRMFETTDGRRWLCKRTGDLLTQLQIKATQQECGERYDYPGTAEDKLFEPTYRHKHRVSPECACNSDSMCNDAVKSSCNDLGCNEEHVVPRTRLEVKRKSQSKEAQEPAIHVGLVGSGDSVIKSGEHRDMIAQTKGIIAFEMEGAGVAEEIPCVVIKGVCDYADCHKNKKWQEFAAATAASALKATLERYMPTVKSGKHLGQVSPPQRHFLVPFGRNRDFVGREYILERLLERIPPNADVDDCQRTAIEGLGGVGKTQIALEAAFQVRDTHPDCSIFWVPALDSTSFDNAYREIGRQLNITGMDEDKADVGSLVKTALSESAGSWLLIVDNADDEALLFSHSESTPLTEYLPFSRNGSILFTTRNHEVVVRLDIPTSGVITTVEMSREDAIRMLRRNLKDSQIRDTASMNGLLDFLADLPLAIRQASAFMARTGMSTTKYLGHCQSSDKKLIALLSEEFEDRGRYKNAKNPVATTWLISFQHISRNKPLAVKYLRFMCLLAEKDIPASLLPPPVDMIEDSESEASELEDSELEGSETEDADPDDGDLEREKAIGILKAYAFITERPESNSFDMHRLVRLATRNWLEKEGEMKKCITFVIWRLDKTFPFPSHTNRHLWMGYLPHAQTALDFQESAGDWEALSHLLKNISAGLRFLGKYDRAATIQRQALELRKKVLGKDHIDTLGSMHALASVLIDQGKYDAAEQMCRQTLKLREKVLGKEHPRALDSMHVLAVVLREQGKYEEAEQMHRQALKLREKVLGKEHPHTLANLHSVALVLREQGKYKEAEQMQRQVFKQTEKVLGKEHPYTLANLHNIAVMLSEQGKYEEAEQMHRQVLKLQERVLGKEHPHIFNNMNSLAVVLYKQGKYEEAEQIYRHTLKLREKVLGKEHPRTLHCMNSLRVILDKQRKYER